MTYTKRILKWIWNGKYLYILIVVIFIVLFAGNIKIGALKTVDNIRIYGLILQLSGTLIIIFSLKAKLLLFKGYGLGTFLLNYFKTFPGIDAKHNYEMKVDMGGFSTITGDLRIVKRPTEDNKDIIRYFDEEIQYLHKRLAETKGELKTNIAEIKSNLDEIKINLGNKINETQQLISDSNISNIWVDSFGISIIFVGLIYGTVPDLVEKLIL